MRYRRYFQLQTPFFLLSSRYLVRVLGSFVHRDVLAGPVYGYFGRTHHFVSTNSYFSIKIYKDILKVKMSHTRDKRIRFSDINFSNIFNLGSVSVTFTSPLSDSFYKKKISLSVLNRFLSVHICEYKVCCVSINAFVSVYVDTDRE